MNEAAVREAGDGQVGAEADGRAEGVGIECLATGSVGDRLRAAGVPLTLQRLAVGQVMLTLPAHMTADQVLARVRAFMPEISRATVYNTLKLFSERGLVRELVIDAERIVFDSNTAPHYHMYDVETGALRDLPLDSLKVVGSAELPPGLELECVDVVVRVRGRKG